MRYLELFFAFLKVGCFAFGGAYGAIPLIRDVVLVHGWLNEETLTYMIAVSESTPGPIMVNLATYVGSTQAGFFGAAGHSGRHTALVCYHPVYHGGFKSNAEKQICSGDTARGETLCDRDYFSNGDMDDCRKLSDRS